MRRASLVVLAIACVSACAFDPSAPADAQIGCTVEADCPAQFTCNELLGRCIPVSKLDGEPPTLSDPSVLPERATVGQIIHVRFTASEALFETPVVMLDIGDATARMTFDPITSEGLRYAFSYVVTGAEAQGSQAVSADIVDANGTEARDVFLGNVELDFRPVVLLGSEVTPKYARMGTELKATLTFNEPIAASSSVTLVSESDPDAVVVLTRATTASQAGSELYLGVVSGTEPEGLYRLVVDVADVVGNRRIVEGAGTVRLDYDAPSVQQDEGPTRLEPFSVDRVVSVNFAVSEIPATSPVVRAVSLLDPQFVVDFAQVGPGALDWTFATSFPASAPDGEFEVRIAALSDAAGNVGSEVVSHLLTLDSTPPTLSNFSPTSARVSATDILEVTFKADEPLRVDPIVKITEELLVRDMSVVHPDYRYTFDVGPSSLVGAHPVEVTLEDMARNLTIERFGIVLVDSLGPMVFDASFSPQVAAQGNLVLFTIVVDEPLQEGADGPDVGFRWAGADPGLHFITHTGLNYIFGFTVGADMAEGVYTLEGVELSDTANNAATIDLTMQAGGAPSVEIDVTPPVITGVALNANVRSDDEHFDDIMLTFDADEDLKAAGSLRVRMGTRDLTCGSFSPIAPSYTCATTVEAGDAEGFNSVVVEARDAAGNQTITGRSLVIDRTPPALVPGSAVLTMTPGPDNPLARVTAATHETRVNIAFQVDEPLGVTPVVETASPSVRTFAPTSAAGVFFIFEHEVGIDNLCPGGNHDVQAKVVDLVGNTATLSLARFRVDGEPPAPPSVAPGAMVLTRAPWGLGGEGRDATEEILEVSLAAGAVDEAGTVLLYGGAERRPSVFCQGSVLSVVDNVPAASPEIGRVTIDPGVPTRHRLAGGDRVQVFAQLVDDAGNPSNAVLVRDSEWIVQMGRKVAGDLDSNPHIFEARAVATSQTHYTFGVGDDPSAEVGGAVLGMFGDTMVTSSVAAQERLTSGERVPVTPPLARMVTTRDAATGGVMALLADASVAVQRRTWSFNGSGWVEQQAGDPENDGSPPSDENAAIAYDGRRGVAVVYGGSTGGPSGDLVWEWTGLSWRSITPPVPGPVFRSRHALAYDPIRRKVLLFGGETLLGTRVVPNNDLWAWDGEAWELLLPNSDAPLKEHRHLSLIVDESRGIPLVHAGFCGTDCDGTVYEIRPDTSGALGFVGVADVPDSAVMAWDPVEERTIFFSPVLTNPAAFFVRTWDGAQLQSNAVTGLDPGTAPFPESVVFDPESGDFFIFAGAHASTLDPAAHEVWRWNRASGRLSRIFPTNAKPAPGPSVINACSAFDAVRDETVMYTQDTAELWAWNGQRWRRAYSPIAGGPAPGGPAVMAFDSRRSVVWLVQGTELWRWDGTSFAFVSPRGQNPTPQLDRLVYDSVRDSLVGFEVETGNRVHEFNPGNERWSVHNVQGGSPFTVGNDLRIFSVVFDEGIGLPVAFSGGVSAVLSSSFPTVEDTIVAVWDGGASSWTTVPVVGPGPRSEEILAYDDVRQAIVLHAGVIFGDRGTETLHDLWLLELQNAVRGDPSGISTNGWRSFPLARPKATTPLRTSVGAWDSARGVLVTAGQTLLGAETWELRPEGITPPSHVFRVDTSVARIPESAVVERLDVRFRSGGTGGALDAIRGVALEGFSNQTFRTVAVNDAPVSAPREVMFSTAVLDEIETFRTGDDIIFRVRPLAAPQVSNPARVETDFVSLVLRFRQ